MLGTNRGGFHGSHARNISFFDLVDYCLYCMDDKFPPPPPPESTESGAPVSGDGVHKVFIHDGKQSSSLHGVQAQTYVSPNPPPHCGGAFFSFLFVKCYFDSICALEDSGVELWYFVLCNTRVEREREG